MKTYILRDSKCVESQKPFAKFAFDDPRMSCFIESRRGQNVAGDGTGWRLINAADGIGSALGTFRNL